MTRLHWFPVQKIVAQLWCAVPSKAGAGDIAILNAGLHYANNNASDTSYRQHFEALAALIKSARKALPQLVCD